MIGSYCKVAPICYSGRVKVKVKPAPGGGYVVDPDGIFVEGCLGTCAVDDKGHGLTSVDNQGVLFDIVCPAHTSLT